MQLTWRAITEMKNQQAGVQHPAGGIRIAISRGNYRPKLIVSEAENIRENEKNVHYEGINIFIDPDTKRQLSGYTIDFGPNGFKVDLLLPGGKCCG